MRCLWLKSYCLQRVRSVPYSLPPNNAMLLLLLASVRNSQPSRTTDTSSAFISPDLWHPTAQIWNKSTKFMTSMNWSSVWSMSGFEQSVINDADDKWCRRLCVGICVKEGNFEHLLNCIFILHIILLILWTLNKSYRVTCSRISPVLVFCVLQGSGVTPWNRGKRISWKIRQWKM